METKPKLFIPQLEAFRGVAACVVAVHHTIGSFNLACAPLLGMLAHLFNGYAAVLIFFVLSGYVLGLSLDVVSSDDRWKNYLKFIARRLFRIYPAYLFSLVVIMLYLAFFHRPFVHSAATSWFNSWYQSAPTFRHAWGILTFKDNSLNNVVWTLRYELLCSSLLPPFHWLSRRLSPFCNFLVFCAIAGIFPLLGSGFAKYFHLFYLGLLIPVAMKSFRFQQLLESRWRDIAMLIFTAGALLAGNELWMRPGLRVISDIFAWLLVLTVAADGSPLFHRFLAPRVVRFYGRISYSFYLLHFVVMYVIAKQLFFKLDGEFVTGNAYWLSFVLLIFSFGGATPLAWLSWKWIEVPVNKLGKRWISFARSSRRELQSSRVVTNIEVEADK